MNISEEELETPQQIPFVIVEGEYIPLEDVEYLNIEEDISNRDLITFNYNNKEYKSFVILKYY